MKRNLVRRHDKSGTGTAHLGFFGSLLGVTQQIRLTKRKIRQTGNNWQAECRRTEFLK
jgi:hypothetical protein